MTSGQAPNGAKAPLKVFISYSRDDRAACEELRRFLAPLERAYRVRFWSDHELRAGDKWDARIRDAIAESDIFLLLCSQHWLSSDYIQNAEAPEIQKRIEEVGGDVIAVILIECPWDVELGVFQAVPTDRTGRLKPILDWHRPRRGFNAAATQITSTLIERHSPDRLPTGWLSASRRQVAASLMSLMLLFIVGTSVSWRFQTSLSLPPVLSSDLEEANSNAGSFPPLLDPESRKSDAERQRQEVAAREAERQLQEAAARDAERERQDAAAREAERLRLEAAAREAERLRQEAAKEDERLRQEAERLRQETSRLQQEALAREAERQRQEAAAKEVERLLQEEERKRQEAAAAKPAFDPRDREVIREMQALLKTVGCYFGGIDGRESPQTNRARDDAIKRLGVSAPGVTEALLAALRQDAARLALRIPLCPPPPIATVRPEHPPVASQTLASPPDPAASATTSGRATIMP